MSFACPHRSVPYSRWRLDVLRRLFGPGQARRSPDLPFLQPRADEHTRSCVRHYSSKPSQSQDRNDACASTQAYKEDSLRQNGKDRTNTAGPHEDRDGNPQFSNETELLTESTDQQEPHRRRTKRAFDPYSLQNRQGIKKMITALEDIATRYDPAEKPSYLDPETGLSWQHKAIRQVELPPLPQSPIFKKGRLKDTPLKIHLRTTEQPLKHDPWARMLAEPVRLCKGSGVRLPTSLISNWSLTRHPTSGEVYLMPSGLANVEKMERVSTRQELRHRKKMARAEVDDDDNPFEDNDPFDELANHEQDTEGRTPAITGNATEGGDPMSYPLLERSSARPGTTPAIRILLYDNLLNLFSLTTLRSRRKRVNVAARLIPRAWLERLEEARQYERNRTVFETLTGDNDPTPPSVEATLEIAKLRWQIDIGERLAEILRKRVMFACERAAMVYAEPKKRKTRHVAIVPMARVRGTFNTTSNLAGGSEDMTAFPDDPNSENSSRNIQLDSRTQPDASTKGDELPARHTQLAPRIFLYLGPNASSNLTTFTNPDRDAMIPPLLRSWVTGRSQRFPIFPIRAMLEEESYQDLLQLLCRYQFLKQDEVAGLDTEGSDHLLMLKPAATNDFIEGLLRAVWRLWRYGGGRRWMEPENEKYEEWKEMLSEMPELQDKKEGSEDIRRRIDELGEQTEDGAIQDQEVEDRALEKWKAH